jgi:adenylate cyclase
VAGAYVSASVYRFSLGNRERRLIKRAFKSYVAPVVVDQLLEDPSRLSLGGEEVEVTILFSDLAGFTTLSEGIEPAKLQSFLSEYFKEMMGLLLDERATLDKFIGDAIMVFFGCPIHDPDHAAQACRAAVAMQERMVELNRGWEARGLPKLTTRVGINTGRVVAGNMGTDEIFNYTILGDAVNLASRLEGTNKQYGTLNIIGEDTHARMAGACETRELDLVRVKGKDTPVRIHELVCRSGELAPELREVHERFARGLAAYREQRWPEAERAFRSALETRPEDGPSAVFLERCRVYAESPPPAGWDGVFKMTTK